MKSKKTDRSRRRFLQAVGVGVPTLSKVFDGVKSDAAALADEPSPPIEASKCSPVDLTRFFNCSSQDFGPRDRAKTMEGGKASPDGLIRLPGGAQNFLGIPFQLGPEGIAAKSWLRLSRTSNSSSANRQTVPIAARAGFVCLAAFCDWDPNEVTLTDEDSTELVGQLLANAVFVYEDDSEKSVPIRRRFEVNSISVPWGHDSFLAIPHRKDAARRLTDPLSAGTGWGGLQTAVAENGYPSAPMIWISALANPEPNRTIKEIRFEAASDDSLVVCGVTLFRGRENPLRLERLSLYRITLPDGAGEVKDRWKVDVDLGVVARTYTLPEFDAGAWLAAPDKGLGERNKPVEGARHLFAQVTASSEATLTLMDAISGARYAFDLSQVMPGKDIEARPAGAHVEILESSKTWLHGEVADAATGKPTPVRIAFLSKNGRYIPPYGHRSEINNAWFQDYGADLKIMDTSFAYIDGTFQVELPTGEVFVEITKGFEFEPVRQKLTIAPGQRELKLEIGRHIDLRSKGWVTADTHTHFLSPSTAVLEGQAEGVNLVSLLAAQWGDLFTNVGDLHYGPLVSRDGETRIEVNSENRQHLLGHLGMVGGHGTPLFPMSASGPSESFFGDPLWTSLADWADKQHARGGLVVAVHFPYPTAELAADITLGKIDAVELYPYGKDFRTLRFMDWYRYLNCGYRVPCVGGTDKMGAYMPVGANRTYAYLGQQEFNFENWAKVVRSGNTFMTTGPLILLRTDGRVPGDEITLGAGGGTIEVEVEAKSFVPFHRLEVVLNGKAVVTREDKAGTREMKLSEKVQVSGPGWIAARCASHYGPTTGWDLGIQAHTSPVYLKIPGQDVFSREGAVYMLTLIEGAEAWVQNLATRPDPESLARVLKTFHDAREKLHQRLHAHGVKH